MQLAQRWRNHLETPFGPSSLDLTRARDALYTVGSDIQPLLAVGQAVGCLGAQTTESREARVLASSSAPRPGAAAAFG